MKMKMLAMQPMFRFDRATGAIIGPAGAVIAGPADQVIPGTLILDVEGLNRLYHLGTHEAVMEDYAQRAHDRDRTEAAKAWLEEDPPIEPPYPAGGAPALSDLVHNLRNVMNLLVCTADIAALSRVDVTSDLVSAIRQTGTAIEQLLDNAQRGVP